MWIEVFKSGKHTDSSGRSEDFSVESLEEIAGKYNSAAEKSDSYEAPLVKGHPKTDAPSYGWVERLKRRGKYLLAKVKDLSPELINEIRKGLYKKVSIALYPDKTLRHVGLLGAASPAVKGLRTVKFEDGEDYSEYELKIKPEGEGKESEYEDGTSYLEKTLKENEALRKKNAALRKKNAALKAEIERIEESGRELEYKEFAESLVKDKGKLTPEQAGRLADILKDAAKVERETGEFEEGESLVDRIKAFATNLKGAPLLGEYALKPDAEGAPANFEFAGRNVNQERLDLHKRALGIKKSNPDMSYERAISLAISKDNY